MPRKTTPSKLIGCNVRAGQPRGGMTAHFRAPRPSGHIGADSVTIKEAANTFLEKRGFQHNPHQMRDSISQQVMEARRPKENL